LSVIIYFQESPTRLAIFATIHSFPGSFGPFFKNNESEDALDTNQMNSRGGSFGSKTYCARLRWMRIASSLGWVGVNKALRLEDAKDGRLRIDEKVAASAFVPAAYSASFAALHCGQYRQKRAYLTSRGKALAQAFNANIAYQHGGNDAMRRILSDSASAPVSTIKKIEHVGGTTSPVGCTEFSAGTDPDYPAAVRL
jgi:hypothetical protein